MSDRDTLLALAERVEGLSNPDRSIDAEVAAALRITPGTPGTEWIKKWDGPFIANPASHGEPGLVALQNGCWWRAFDFTASIDVAMKSVPKGWHVGMLTECDEDGNPSCCLTQNEEPCRDAVGRGADMALSLVAASLRARAPAIREVKP